MPQIHSTPPSEIPPAVLDLPIDGQNLESAVRFGELLEIARSAKPTLLAFLRHFG